MRFVLAVGLLSLFGCDRAPPPRQTADPGVPVHALRERFLGRWQASDGSVLVIEARLDGSVEIEPSANAVWDSAINSVRWEGDSLCFDVYQYGKEKVNVQGYDGSRIRVVLTITDNPIRLNRSVLGERTGDPINDQLERTGR